MQHWLKLTMPEKRFLLSVVKNYVQLKEELLPISIEEYNKEINEAMKSINSGAFCTHQQVEEISKGWLNSK